MTVTIKNMYFLHYGAMSLKPQTTIFQEIMDAPGHNHAKSDPNQFIKKDSERVQVFDVR